MRNLTRDEAASRAAAVTVESYDVHLVLTDAEDVESTTTVRFRSTAAESFLELDGELLELTGATAGPQEGNRIPLSGLGGEHEVTVRARCSTTRTGEGLHRFVDPADGLVYLWGQSFLDDAQRVFACFDQPDLKAVIRLTVDAPSAWTVVGNARGYRDGDRWTFAPTERISTYLFTVAAGPWHSAHRQHGDIELGLHCRQSLAQHLDADADELFDVTARCFDFQQEAFGRRYPFGDTYDQLFVPEFNHGAMENPGAVTFTEDFVFRSRVTDDRRRRRAMVVAHEMSHMWFGDLVTMRWWDDLWLNESFAELMGFLTVDRATSFEGIWQDFSATRKGWGYRADQLSTTHPVQGDVPDNRSALLNFDGISYAKGASVLRQLMATIGEDAFFAGVRSYLERHAFGNTTFADLLAELERASGRDLQEWARLWLQTTGVSTLRPVDGEIRQESDVLRPHRIGVGSYDRQAGVLVARDRLDVSIDGASAPLPGAPADLVLLNDGDLTFAKVRFDERSLETALADVRLLQDGLSRALVWAALWDACRDAELPASRFVRAVLDNVSGETDPAVVEALLSQARTAASLYASGDGLLDDLAAGARAALTAAAPGSDLQLVQARALAAAARSAVHVAAVQGLLDGTAVPAGLVVDTELRWTLVKALAALGRVDDDAVRDELSRDDTAAGRLHAIGALAGMPDAASKERAWEQATRAESSNLEVRAAAEDLWKHGQDDLLAPYVDRYVAELPRLWDARSPQIAGTLASGLFPSTLVRQDVLDRTAALLDPEHPAGLRRLVAEARDDLARALRARAAAG